jgi:hypothetical protein
MARPAPETSEDNTRRGSAGESRMSAFTGGQLRLPYCDSEELLGITYPLRASTWASW